jgi:hypothetical protein
MDILSSSSLRRKIFKYKILLDPKLQEAENTITILQSNIHHNMVTTTRLDHPCPSLSVLEAKEMKRKLTVIKQEVSNGHT